MALYDPVYGYAGQPMLQIPQPTVVQPPTSVLSQPQTTQQVPFVKVITLAGESAAKSLKLAAGSTLFAADETDPVIWFIKANEVGPNTVYSIPFDPAILSGGNVSVSADLSAIENRLNNIEERMKRYESDAPNDKQHSSGSGNSNTRR
ncbi:MAG: hypothetical protein J6U54_03375 [Clostridiales bacterium]|nr:hypothetical protein [Clostridiales bacterium]